MKMHKTIYLLAALGLFQMSQGLSAQTKELPNGYPYSQVPFTAVRMSSGTFWGDRLQAAREVTIPLAFSKCETTSRYKNFEMAAYTLQHPGHPGLKTEEWDMGRRGWTAFDDTDVYKTIEGASYILSSEGLDSPEARRLAHYVDSVLDIVAAAQEPDGYLYTARTINPEKPHRWSGATRWSEEENSSHELYDLGHMVDAACAHYQATGSTKFLDIARRYADCALREVGPAEGQAHVVPGHQIAEMALARLYLLTGQKSYLDEARYLLEYRGRTDHKAVYSQSDKPVAEQSEAWGHAVRAGYMYAGMADVAALTGDSALLKAIDRISENIIGRKYYITGGVGARHAGEAFGADYELPNLTAYNETCAAIAMVYLFQRMFMLHGDARYIDCLERTLYNGVISGMSVDGGKFFYPNPLSCNGQYRFNSESSLTRRPWFGCACCPSNVCRFIPSVPGYVYGLRADSLYVNLFAGNTARLKIRGRDVVLSQETDYPWQGTVKLRIQKNRAGAFSLMLRIPGWTHNQPVPGDLYSYANTAAEPVRVELNGQSIPVQSLSKGYLRLNRRWKSGDVVTLHFPMPVRTVRAKADVRDDAGRIAVERGPLVYCAEGTDNPSVRLPHVLLSPQASFDLAPDYSIPNTEADGRPFQVTALNAPAQEAVIKEDGRLDVRPVTLRLIPYYAWNHRGATTMDVWLPCGLSGLQD